MQNVLNNNVHSSVKCLNMLTTLNTQYNQLHSNLNADRKIYHSKITKDKDYDYTISTQFHWDNLEITITEQTSSGKYSNGGSHFFITQEYKKAAWFRSMCQFQDNFNGVYNVCCPSVGNNCTNVTIIRNHSPYHGFVWRGAGLEEVRKNETRQIWSANMCRNFSMDHSSNYTLIPFQWQLTENKSVKCCENLYRNGRPVTVLSDTEACQCLSHYERITVLGASHTRYFVEYLNKVCHGTMFSVPFKYVYTKYSKHMSTKIEHYIHNNFAFRNISTPGKSAVWLQTGSWDLKYTTTHLTLTEALPAYMKSLKKLKNVLHLNHMVELHVIAPPPNPDDHIVNNFVEAVYVHHLQNFAKQNDISFFNSFQALLPCLNEHANYTENKNHYFFEGTGRVGRVYWFGEFLGTICQGNMASVKLEHL